MTKDTILNAMTEISYATKRLSVQHWQSTLEDPQKRADLCGALTPLLSPQVLVDLPPSMQVDEAPEAVSNWIDARAVESECFIVTQNSDGAVLGLLILVQDIASDSMPTLHIGYLLAQNAWGKGYATELVAGLLNAAKPRAPLRIIGGVAKSNPASARVLRKLGFLIQPESSTDETEMYSLIVKPSGG